MAEGRDGAADQGPPEAEDLSPDLDSEQTVKRAVGSGGTLAGMLIGLQGTRDLLGQLEKIKRSAVDWEALALKLTMESPAMHAITSTPMPMLTNPVITQGKQQLEATEELRSEMGTVAEILRVSGQEISALTFVVAVFTVGVFLRTSPAQQAVPIPVAQATPSGALSTQPAPTR